MNEAVGESEAASLACTEGRRRIISGSLVARPLTLPYLSPAWAQEAARRLREDRGVREAVSGADLSILVRILEAPPGRCAWLHARLGGPDVAQTACGSPAEEPPAASFTVQAAYATLAAMRRGELAEDRAFLGGHVQVQGNRLAALRYLGPLSNVLRVLQSIPAET